MTRKCSRVSEWPVNGQEKNTWMPSSGTAVLDKGKIVSICQIWQHFESLKLGPGGSWDWGSMCERKSGVARDIHQNKPKKNYDFFTIAQWAETRVWTLSRILDTCPFMYCWLSLEIQEPSYGSFASLWPFFTPLSTQILVPGMVG